MDNATTGIVTQGIRHGFWVNDLGPPVGGRPQADTLPQQTVCGLPPVNADAVLYGRLRMAT